MNKVIIVVATADGRFLGKDDSFSNDIFLANRYDSFEEANKYMRNLHEQHGNHEDLLHVETFEINKIENPCRIVGLRNLYEEYKENKELKEFSIYHFYSGDLVENPQHGIFNHRWIKVVGYNFATKEYCELCPGNPHRFDEIRVFNLIEKNNISGMGYWHDNSFFIRFIKPVRKPDFFNTFYITDK